MNKRFKVYGLDSDGCVWDILSFDKLEDAVAQVKKSNDIFKNSGEFCYIIDSATNTPLKNI